MDFLFGALRELMLNTFDKMNVCSVKEETIIYTKAHLYF